YIHDQQRDNHTDFQHCLFTCFLSQIEPRSIAQALKDPSWVDAMQEEMQQFKFQNVWVFVDLSEVARIEAIRLFLAFASYLGFMVYQMDVKSAFLYGRIDEEVYVTQPKGFVDPQHPKKVYKQLEEEILGWEAAQRLQAQELADLEKQRAESLMKDANLARQMAQDFEMTEDQRKRQQEVLASAANYLDAAWDIILARLQANPDLSSTIFGVDFTDDDFAAKMVDLVTSRRKELAEQRAQEQRDRPMTPAQLRAVAFTRGLKRDGSPMTNASSKKLKTGDVEVPSNIASTAQQTASSLKKNNGSRGWIVFSSVLQGPGGPILMEKEISFGSSSVPSGVTRVPTGSFHFSYWLTTSYWSPELGPPAILASLLRLHITLQRISRSQTSISCDGGSRKVKGAGVAVQAIPPPIPEPILEPMPEPDQPQDHLSTPPRQQTAGHTSRETELKDTKKLFKDVVGKLVKKVKAMEVKLKTKKRKVVVSDSDQEEGGEQDVDLDALLALANAVVIVDSNIYLVVLQVLFHYDVYCVAPLAVTNKAEKIHVRRLQRGLHDDDQAQVGQTMSKLKIGRQQESSLLRHWTLLGDDVTVDTSQSGVRRTFLQASKSTEAPIPSVPDVPQPPVGSSPKSSGTRRKSLGRNRLTKPKSILKELDLDADDKTFIKVVSDEDSTDEAPILWSNQSTKHFTTIREILHMVDRQDLLKLYGMVVTYYENHLIAGAGLMLWGDLQVLMDSQEGGKGSFVWNHQSLWQIRSWRLYTLSNVHVLETVFGEVLYMFVDVSYPLLVKLMERMLKHKLEIDKDVSERINHQLEICHETVGNELTTAVQLIAFLKKQISDSKRPKVHDWYTVKFVIYLLILFAI
ncbi:synaptobrevin, longin-like domain protein, partial [Tanacetum coccineum]